MHSRFGDDGQARGSWSSAPQIQPVRHESRSERVREIRRRVADDVYRSDAVIDEIARRILWSREL